MKKLTKITAMVMSLVLCLLSLSSCKSNYALKIGDRIITPEQYKAAAVSIKTQFLAENGIEDTEDQWTKPMTENDTTTLQEYLDAMIQSYLIEYNLYAIHFDELGLKISEERAAKIQNELDTYIKQYGSEKAFDEALKKSGFSYKDYKEQLYNEAKKSEVILYYFGPDSKKNPTTHQQIKEYYNEYYTKVKHIFISTRDSNSNDFTVAQKEETGKKAQEIYDRIIAGEDYDTLLDEFNQDPGMVTNPDGYIFSQDDTSYTRAFHNAAFDMAFDEVRLVQSNLGFHIMKRYEFITDDVTDPEVELNLISNMMGNEIADVLQQLKDRIGVTYNDKILINLSVVNIDTVSPEQTTEETQTQQTTTTK